MHPQGKQGVPVLVELAHFPIDWGNASDKYDNDWGAPRWASEETVFGQGFEETLNFNNFVQNGGDMQLDLLFPVKEKDGMHEIKNKIK